MEEKNRVSIIDADFIPYYICYNKKDETPKTLDDIYVGINKYMTFLLDITKATRFVGFLSPKKTFRNDINTEYKAQRKTSDICYLHEAKVYLKEQWRCLIFDNLEADDCCLILENQLKNDYNITIISPDKDIRFTEGNRYNPNKNEFSVCTKDQSDEYFWKSMIIGDSADNIKGVPGKGIKFAEKLFDIKTRYEATTLMIYVDYFGEYKGIEEFYKNYKSLMILRECEDFKFDINDLIYYDYKERVNKEE